MRKVILMTALIMMAGLAGMAQSFEKGSQAVNIGIGLGPGWRSGSLGFSFGVNGSYEYGIVEVPMGSTLTGVVGVGGIAGAGFSGATYGLVDNYSSINYFVAARGNYHFIFHDDFDPYASVLIGFHGYSDKWKGDGPEPPKTTYSGGDFRAGVVVGARYLFSDKFGVYAELGYLLHVFNAGITYKLK